VHAHAIERDLYTYTGKKIDDPRGKHYNAIHTAKKHDPRQKKNYGKNNGKNTAKAAKGQNTAKTAGTKCTKRRKDRLPWAKMDLGGQKC